MRKHLVFLLALSSFTAPLHAEERQYSSADGWKMVQPIKRTELPTKVYPATEPWGHFQDMSDYYLDNGQFQEAESASKQAIEAAQNVGNTDIQSVLYANLGSAFRAQGRFEEAASAYKQAVDALSKQPQLDQVAIAMMLNNVGDAYRSGGQFDKAIPVLLEAKAKLAPGKPVYDVVLQNLGMCYAKLNQNAEAEQTFKQAIEVSSDKSHYNGRSIVEAMYSLSLLYAKQNRIDDLSKLVAKAIPISESTFGGTNIRTLKLKELQAKAQGSATAKAKQSMSK